MEEIKVTTKEIISKANIEIRDIIKNSIKAIKEVITK